jgi:DNA invertase Pin-like site-specific DNA recombinase
MIDNDYYPKDEGCEFSPSCLNCPLPRCIEDEPGGRQRIRKKVRDDKIADLRRDGKSIAEIADTFGVSKRSIYRALAATRAEVQ